MPSQLDDVYLDFETYWAPKYSLTTFSYTDYVYDERFRVEGLGLALNDEPAVFVPPVDVDDALRTMPFEARWWAHNMPFDGLILHAHFDVHPLKYACSMALFRALVQDSEASLDQALARLELGGKVHKGILVSTKGRHFEDFTPEEQKAFAEYTIGDVEGMRELVKTLRPYYPEAELEIQNISHRCFCCPVLELDAERARAALEAEQERKAELIKSAGVSKSVLSSNDKFAQHLRDIGVEPPTKTTVSAKTGIEREAYAFSLKDLAFKELFNQPELVPVLEARLGVKSTITENQLERLLRTQALCGNLPIGYNQHAAKTHRAGGTNKLNFQTLPRDNGNDTPKERIRGCLRAPKGHVVLVGDSSQIEARLVAKVAGQEDLVEDFRNQVDVYSKAAAGTFKSHVDKETVMQDAAGRQFKPRNVGKVQILGLGFGMGAPTFRTTLALGPMGAPPIYLSMPVCQEAVDSYRRTNHKVQGMWTTMGHQLFLMTRPKHRWEIAGATFQTGGIQLPNGLFIDYPDLHVKEGSENEWVYRTPEGWYKKIYGGLLYENFIQALARCVVFDQMLELSRDLCIAMMTHDEIVAVVPEREADEAATFMREVMSKPPQWLPDLPVACEVGYDQCYSK